jgi:orotate phosphoribosyltransferase
MTTPQQELLALVTERSYRAGLFTLASGQESDFYVDVKQTAFHARGSYLIGELTEQRLVAEGIDMVGGMAVGAIPLVSATLDAAARAGRDLLGFFVRKDVKAHGTAQRIDGCFDAGKRIALLEDVVTTGGSTLQAIDAVEAAGGRVELIITIVDREENDGMARLAARVPKVETLLTRSQIVAYAAGS